MDAPSIAAVFDACFAGPATPADERARMVRGGDEPLYLPAGRGRGAAEIVYARGLAQSCLHEAAHWLRAGLLRRRLVDYGYWYLPDGRDRAAQRRFEAHEAAVQDLELLLALAAGVRFSVSCDNLDDPVPTPAFRAAIAAGAERRLADGLGARARRFAEALAAACGRRWDDIAADVRGRCAVYVAEVEILAPVVVA